jgi:hypothetical protein
MVLLYRTEEAEDDDPRAVTSGQEHLVKVGVQTAPFGGVAGPGIKGRLRGD